MTEQKIRTVILSLLLVCAPLIAQTETATIRGNVVDSTGAVVVGADISLVEVNTNAKRLNKTNENGDYEFPHLLRGAYRLSVMAPGFKEFVADNLLLESTEVRRLNAALEVGSTGTQITVQANAGVIATDTAKISGVFTSQRFDQNPLATVYMLLYTLPHVTYDNSGGWVIAGQRGAQIAEGMDGFTTDGAVNNFTAVVYMQEFSVVGANNSAENSRVAYVGMVTKSGSDQFHGRLAFWHQNSALNARDYFAATKPHLLGDNYFVDFGGPIRKNKTFFYVGTDHTLYPGGSYNLRSVPTASMRSGNFSGFSAIKDPLGNSPFPANTIPANRISSVSTKVLNEYMPSPNLGSANATSNNYGFLWPHLSTASKTSDGMVRFDQLLSEKNRLYGRWLARMWPLATEYAIAGSYPGLGWTRQRHEEHLVVEDTHMISPAFVNTFQFGWYRMMYTDGDKTLGFTPLKGDQVVKELGIQGVNDQNLSAMGFPTMSISGYSALSVTAGGKICNDRFGYSDSLTWVKGRHVLKFGAQFNRYSQFTGTVPAGTYGSFNFTGNLTGNAFGDFLLGAPYTSTRLSPLVNRTQLDKEIGIYAQDAFKITNRLTLDYGLRWERFGSAGYQDGLVYNWDPTTGNVIVPSSTTRSVSSLYPKAITISSGNVQERPSLGDFAPRIGLAYRVGDKTVVRGGYGIFTENLGQFARAFTGGPFQLSETFTNSVTNGGLLFTFPNPFPSATGAVASQSVSGYPLNTENGRIHQFSFTIDRQLHDVGIRLSYIASRSRGLNYSLNIDRPAPSLIPFTQSRQPYPQFVSTSWIQSDGMANYNSLSLEVQRKVGQVTFDNTWTWAANYTKNPNTPYPYEVNGWSRDGFTPKQRVLLNVMWRIPVGHGRSFLKTGPKALDLVLGGWGTVLDRAFPVWAIPDAHILGIGSGQHEHLRGDTGQIM